MKGRRRWDKSERDLNRVIACHLLFDCVARWRFSLCEQDQDEDADEDDDDDEEGESDPKVG